MSFAARVYRTLADFLSGMPEWAKYIASCVVLVASIAVVVVLLSKLWWLLDRLQRAYWGSQTSRRWIKRLMYVLLVGAVLSFLVAVLSYIARAAAEAVGLVAHGGADAGSWRSGFGSAASVLITSGVVLLCFVSWCKSKRADALEALLAQGNLPRALVGLEELVEEPGQNVSIDARVACLYAYALILGGNGSKAVECLQNRLARLRGSANFQDRIYTSDAHRTRINFESVESLGIQLARAFCEIGQFDEAVKLTAPAVLQSSTEVLRCSVRGLALMSLGRAFDAEPVLARAIKLAEGLGDSDDEIRDELHSAHMNMGLCMLQEGRTVAAEAHAEHAARKLATLLAPGHPDRVDCEVLLSRIRFAAGRPVAAWKTLSTALDSELEFLALVLEGLREIDLLRFLRRIDRHVQEYLAQLLVWQHDAGADLEQSIVYLARRKCLSISASAWMAARARRSTHWGKRLEAVRNLLAESMYGARHSWQPTLQQIDTLAEEKARLERSVALEASEDLPPSMFDRLDIGSLRRCLGSRDALIDFWRVNSAHRGAPHYVLFLLPGGDRPPIMKDLGPVRALQSSIVEFYRSCRESTSTNWWALGSSLYERIFGAIDAQLAACERIFVAPDGDLNYLPFAALVDRSGRLLVERFEISILGAGRDLLRADRGSPSANGDVVLVGDPAFDLRPVVGRAATRGLGSHPYLKSTADQLIGAFGRLPGTRREIERVSRLFSENRTSAIHVLTDQRASKANVIRFKAPAVLHLATHAFHLPPPSWEKRQSDAFFSMAGIGSSHSGLPTVEDAAPGDYLRVGMALAGANSTKHGRADGLLTGEEILSLDLVGTRLVVLSACETAIGTWTSSEGVHGLHRAFLVAGAHAVVASLWKIDDDATAPLIIEFYASFLEGLRPAAALRKAMMKRAGLGGAAARQHPSNWAGFACFGVQNASWTS